MPPDQPEIMLSRRELVVVYEALIKARRALHDGCTKNAVQRAIDILNNPGATPTLPPSARHNAALPHA